MALIKFEAVIDLPEPSVIFAKDSRELVCAFDAFMSDLFIKRYFAGKGDVRLMPDVTLSVSVDGDQHNVLTMMALDTENEFMAKNREEKVARLQGMVERANS